MAFTGLSRIAVQLNSCINPIIYAATIPAYKQIVKGLMSCNIERKMNDIEMQTPTSAAQKSQ